MSDVLCYYIYVVLNNGGLEMASIDFKHTPYGDLALISMRGCEDIASQVDYYLKQWRNIPEDESFVIPANCPRFGTGEAKAVLKHIKPPRITS